jgi:hypothetical protein
MQIVVVGNTVTWRGVMYNEAGDPTDPSGSVYIRVQKPGVAEVTYEYGVDAEVVKNDTGDYEIVLVPAATELGIWNVRLAGFTSAPLYWAATESPFRVAASVFATP